MLAPAVDSDGASTTSVKTPVGSTFYGDVLLTLRSGRRDFVGRAVTVTTACITAICSSTFCSPSASSSRVTQFEWFARFASVNGVSPSLFLAAAEEPLLSKYLSDCAEPCLAAVTVEKCRPIFGHKIDHLARCCPAKKFAIACS